MVACLLVSCDYITPLSRRRNGERLQGYGRKDNTFYIVGVKQRAEPTTSNLHPDQAEIILFYFAELQ